MTETDRKKTELEKEIDAYEYLEEHLVGSLTALKEHVTEKLIKYFVNAGIIAYGIDAIAEERYRVTLKGKKIIDLTLRALYLKLV